MQQVTAPLGTYPSPGVNTCIARTDEIERLRQALQLTQLMNVHLLNEERRQRAAAEVAEQNLKGVLDASPQPLVLLDRTGIVTSWNKAAERTFGWSAEEIQGEAIPIIPSGEQEEANRVFLRLLRGETVVDLEIQRFRKDGSPVHLSLSAAPLHDSDGRVASIMEIYADITDRKQTQQMLEHLALHDHLTGLWNRSVLMERIEESISDSSESQSFVVLVMDLDSFKEVNDRLGHKYGDAVLQNVAAAMEACVRRSDVVARLGGDEFGLLLHGARHRDATMVAAKIVESLRSPMTIDGRSVSIGTSIGMAEFPRDGATAAELVHRADLAMYECKRGFGKGMSA